MAETNQGGAGKINNSRRSFLKAAGVGVLAAGALAVGYEVGNSQVQQLNGQLQQASTQVSTLQSSVNSLTQQLGSNHPYIYIFSATGTAIVDPTNWNLIAVAGGVAGSWENHYMDQFGRLWNDFSAAGTNAAGTNTVMPKNFKVLNTIEIGNNTLNTVGLTPDGKSAVVPVSTINQWNVYDTASYAQVATVPTGIWPCDMMVSPDGKYAGSPDRDSDSYTLVDPATWTVLAHIPIGAGTAPYMDTISPDSKLVSIQNVAHHGARTGSSLSGTPTGLGFSNSYVDLGSQKVVAQLPLTFSAVFDEFTPNSKYDFIFGASSPTVIVVDVATLAQTDTITLPAGPSYVTPDPNGKYVYASVQGTLVVIDANSFEILQTIQTGGISGTPLVLT